VKNPFGRKFVGGNKILRSFVISPPIVKGIRCDLPFCKAHAQFNRERSFMIYYLLFCVTYFVVLIRREKGYITEKKEVL